jgi:hypothetical protein
MSGSARIPASKSAKKSGALAQYAATNKRGIIVVGVLGGIVVCGWLFTERTGSAPPSNIAIQHQTSDVLGTKGTQVYNQQVADYSGQQSQAALRGGTSYIAPITLGPNQRNGANSLAIQGPGSGVSTPSSQQTTQVQNSVPIQNAQAADQTQQAMLAAYTREIQGLMAANSGFAGPTTIRVDQSDPSTNAGRANNPAASGTSASSTPSISIGDLGLAPGDVLYAVVDVGADSDEPGPVMVHVVTGPLNGAKLMGNFTREKGELVVQFSSLSFNNQTYGLTSVAIDTQTSLPAVRSSVNHHYLAEFGDLAAGAFLGAAAGYGQAVAQAGQESVETSGLTSTITTPLLTPVEEGEVAGAQAAGTVAQVVGSGLMNNYNQPATVKLNAGKAIAVLIESAQAPSNLPSTTAPQATPQQTQTSLLPSPIQVGRGFSPTGSILVSPTTVNSNVP